MNPPPLPADHQAALNSAVYFPQPLAGYLRLGDADRVDFLQRQTTNDLQALAPDRTVTTVLTSPTARILDVLTIVDEGESLGALPLPGRTAATARFLQGKIFFMDKVRLEDASAGWTQIDLEGPEAGGVVESLGIGPAPQTDHVQAGQLEGISVQAIGRRGLSGIGYRLLVPAEAGQAALDLLEEAGVARLTPASRELLRVEAGAPEAGRELVEDYTPLEVGLDWAISDSKGCYTGQEIIARQITYDKVTRQLVGLRAEAPMEPGWRVLASGSAVGAVTSAAVSPHLGPIALAVVRRPHHEAGTRLVVEGGDRQGAAEVVGLPFEGYS